MGMDFPLREVETPPANYNHKRSLWTNDDKVELIKLRLQGLTFLKIGSIIGRTGHACRSEYGRIRRGEADVTISLKELPMLRKALPLKKA